MRDSRTATWWGSNATELTSAKLSGHGFDGKTNPHHAQSGESSQQQPQNVEQEVEVDVVGNKQHHTVTKQTVTLNKTGSDVAQTSAEYYVIAKPKHREMWSWKRWNTAHGVL